ncbi:PEP/pyruvate-binding domain-containing protein [Natronolimnohabitans innermongolicus]|uniref:Probable phosphoenolpyruvate synthase n=1 Tax=Natronolimnohabitans innermongolicus JCM 12255 TaxID=1227499 RepID=L9WNZ4_9EURY|nr:PEP/pyruvate-binding domain-containing protein [Natronolimnohabitans innermongolicus]ELY51097.1 phosphoenolpyruvate synthase/pyruvate phosphate dikinase [Natronolimnohabitans innermongolicus JCM 12255]
MTDSPYTLRFDEPACNKDNVQLVGGKNASLGELMAVDDSVQVPPGFAVTTTFYEAFIDDQDLVASIEDRLADADVDDDTSVAAASEDIRERIEEASFPSELEDELASAWTELRDRNPSDELEVAVRSSATAEDLPDASFAGQQDTYLNVRDLEQVKQRTKECMASLFTARAISYREENGFDHDEVLISVGIQKMVEARSSGVMFTVNPANGDRSKVRIESNWGLGESVVSGSVTPDSFLVDKPVYKIVDRNITEKRVMTVPTDAGIEEISVDDERTDVPSLTANEIIDLTDVAKAIEQHYGEPQDIEWAIAENGDETQLYILQSRPETTWNDAADDESTSADTKQPGEKSTAESILERL